MKTEQPQKINKSKCAECNMKLRGTNIEYDRHMKIHHKEIYELRINKKLEEFMEIYHD